jgi:Trk K+ transport system NAD-binding subunit
MQVSGGKVGARIIGELHDLGHRVVGIELSEDADGVAIAQRLKIPVVIAPAEREDTLRAARVGHCRALVCATAKTR